MFVEYNRGVLAPFLHGQVPNLAIGWPLSIPQADAQPYVVLADGTRRPYGVVESLASGATPPAVDASPDLGKAWSAGAELGKRYRGNPWRAARDEEMEIILVSAQDMARLGKTQAPAGQHVTGRLRSDAGSLRIYVLATLSAAEQNITIAHEIAHWLHHGASEAFCELWAKGFCAQGTPAGWR